VASPLHSASCMTNLQTIDPQLLSTIVGGQAQPGPGPEDGPPPRTWKGVAKSYARACVQGAGENLVMMGAMGGFGGPAGALGAAGLGCAMGVGQQGLSDGINAVFGPEE
jgi:hypothetical protein